MHFQPLPPQIAHYEHRVPLKNLIYVWDDADRLCYVTQKGCMGRGNLAYTCLGCVLEEGTPHPSLPHGVGTQADLERACRSLPWWQEGWSFPPLAEDPVPF